MILENTIETLGSIAAINEKPLLHIVTKRDDICDGRSVATVMKYYTVKPLKGMMCKDYEIYEGRILKRIPYTIEPRKFYTITEIKYFVEDLKSKAGRDLTDDEIAVMLRTISKGEPYVMTFLVDVTEELKEQLKWRDIK